MSRTLSSTFLQAIFSPETNQVPVILIRISHTSLTEDIKISTDNHDSFTVDSVGYRGTTSNVYDGVTSENYTFCPIDVSFPDDSAEAISSATLRIDNVSRDLITSIRTITSPPTMTIIAVLASSPNTKEARFDNFTLSNVTIDAFSVTGTISLGNFLNEPYPGGSMLPSNFPGLYANV